MTGSVEPAPVSELLRDTSPAYRKSMGRYLRLTLKELKETLRDRRTIITLVLMPLLIYPLLSVAFKKVLLTNLSASSEVVFLIAVESKEDKSILLGYLTLGESLIKNSRNNSTNSQEASRDDSFESEQKNQSGRKIKILIRPDLEPSMPDLEASVENRQADVGFRIIRTEPYPSGRMNLPAIDCEVVFLEKSVMSERAVEFIESRLRAVNDIALDRQLKREKIERRMTPIKANHKAIPHQQESLMKSLATLIPLVLILMTITGAVYPAIDLTAGERERGTLEILIAAPVPRMGLLLAKYTAVVVVSLLTATVNLAAMMVTVLSIGLGPFLFGEEGLSLGVVAQIFGLLILFALFFSAILLSVTSYARSFKEAQTYLIPLMLVSLAPGMLSMIPGLKLEGPLAVVPLVNIVLLARDLFHDAVDPTYSAVVLLSTVGYSLLAIAVAARTFGSDAILYGSRGSWSDLLRRPAEHRVTPSVSHALSSLLLMLPLFILIGSSLNHIQNLSLGWRLGINSAVTAVLCGGIPVIVAVCNNISIRDGFQLLSSSPIAFAAAIMFGLSLWPFVFEIVLISKDLMARVSDSPGTFILSDDLMEKVKKMMEEMRSFSLAAVLCALAVIPAVFEEFFFRGYLLGAIRSQSGPVRGVLISAACFGLFHIVTGGVLTLERFLPSTFLGIILGWVCVRSGSVFPGMVLHACHNGVLLTISHYQEWLEAQGIGIEEQTHLPAGWLITAAIVAGIGIFLLIFAVRPNSFSTHASRTSD
jgi:sodium transport system permease protein